MSSSLSSVVEFKFLSTLVSFITTYIPLPFDIYHTYDGHWTSNKNYFHLGLIRGRQNISSPFFVLLFHVIHIRYSSWFSISIVLPQIVGGWIKNLDTWTVDADNNNNPFNIVLLHNPRSLIAVTVHGCSAVKLLSRTDDGFQWKWDRN